MQVIAFVGDRGAGKDTACDAMRIHNFSKVAFADPLREVAQLVFGLTMHEMTDRELKETQLDRWPFMSPRQILMRVGTECFRDQFPGVWINAWTRRAAELGKVVVPDCRFHDEAAAIKAVDGVLVRIRRPGFETQSEHRSEIEWKEFDFDYELINDCSTDAEWQVRVINWYSKLRADIWPYTA